MKKLIVANFKMSQTTTDTKNYFTKLICKLDNPTLELVVCPPFTSLSVARFFTEGTEIKLGAQNLSDDENQLTGEISATMLKAVDVDYVLIGHSDRRNKFKEGNIAINKKIKSALKQGLKCILCVGENSVEKTAQKTAEVLKKEVEEGLKGLYENELESVVIAYEPVWAVGTGKNASIKEIEEGCKIIRKIIRDNYSEKAGRDIQVIYGGSLNTINAGKLLQAKEIDGAMFGSASLDVDAFVSIMNKLR